MGKAAWKLMGKPIPEGLTASEEMAMHLVVPHVAFYDPFFTADLQVADVNNIPFRRSNDTEQPKVVNSLSPKKAPSKGPLLPSVLTASDQSKHIKTFNRFLSLCHEAVSERLEDGKLKISAPNPDDEALACAAAFFGYEFKDRKKNMVYVFEHETQQLFEVEVLYIIPFTSLRKRMSVIVRDVDNKIKILTKGADSAIVSRLVPAGDAEITRRTLADIDRYFYVCM